MHLTSTFCIGGGLRAYWLKEIDCVWGCQPQKQLAIDLKMPKLKVDIRVLKEIDLAAGQSTRQHKNGGGPRSCWLKETDYVCGCQPQKQFAIHPKIPKLAGDTQASKVLDLRRRQPRCVAFPNVASGVAAAFSDNAGGIIFRRFRRSSRSIFQHSRQKSRTIPRLCMCSSCIISRRSKWSIWSIFQRWS